MTDKLELKSSHEVVYTVDVADVDSIFYCHPTDPDILTVLMKDGKRLYCDEVCPVDSLQEEPASKRFAFKAIPRLLEMIEPTDRAKAYTAKLADALEVEGYSTDAKIVRVSLKIMNGEKVSMATMDSEPVSEQIDFEKELYKAFGQVKDFTLGMRIAKWFYDMGKNSQEPVSECLEEASKEWLKPQLDKSYADYGETKMMELTHFDGYAMLDAIEFGAKWQKEKEYTCYEEAFEDGATWKVENLWKPADGDDLPEIDREVIALTQPYPNDEHLRVVFAHRPNKYANVWNSDLGEEQVVEIERHGKGGWNQPNVKWWLDCSLPNMEED